VVVTDEVDVEVVVLDVVLVGEKGSVWVMSAPTVATNSIVAAANDINLIICFMGLFSNPLTILSTSDGVASKKCDASQRSGATMLPRTFQ
jgi:hypothetical protein